MPAPTPPASLRPLLPPEVEEEALRQASLANVLVLLELWQQALASGHYHSIRDAPANPMARPGRSRSWVLPRLRVKSPGKAPTDYFSAVGVLYDVASPHLDAWGLFNYWDYANLTMEYDNHMFLQIPWRVGWYDQPDVRSLGTEGNLPRVLTRYLGISPEELSDLSGRGNFGVAAAAVGTAIVHRS